MGADLAVVIVTYNSAHVIDGLLRSLPAALGTVEAEIVVVDNGSSDGTVEQLDSLARSGARLKVVRSQNLGYSAGINLGVAHAPASANILVLNPDVRLHENAVPIMLRALLDEPRVGVVAPRIVDSAGHRVDSLRREPSLSRAIGLGFTRRPRYSEYLTEQSDYDHGHPVDWATGAILLFSRECFAALDGWDESYFLYSEETDFCLRAADAGWVTSYEPLAAAEHIGGQSGRDAATHIMQIVNRVRFYTRRHDSLRGWAYYLLTLASEASWVLRGHPQSRASVIALLRPSRRPTQLNCSDAVLPR